MRLLLVEDDEILGDGLGGGDGLPVMQDDHRSDQTRKAGLVGRLRGQ